MSTNGVVSIVENGQVTVKAICGCNGFNAHVLRDRIEDEGLQSAFEVYQAACNHSFGCTNCLVVMDKNNSLHGDFEIKTTYRETFNDPEFNPRWECGLAEHVAIIERSV